MRHAVSFVFKAVSAVRAAASEAARGKSVQIDVSPMFRLDADDLRSVTGGDGGGDTLPKGGWKAAAMTVA